nr:lactose permease [Quercus suber]
MPWVGKASTGTWMPVYVCQSSKVTAILLSTLDVVLIPSLSNGLNILPSYIDYFGLTPATTGLQTSSLFIGGALAGLCWGQVTDVVGRRASLLYASMITIAAVVLQTAAIDVAMFTIGSTGNRDRTMFQILIFNDSTYTCWLRYCRLWMCRSSVPGGDSTCGGLIAAGVTYGTAQMSSTWAWRVPSAIQGGFSVICILILPFVPESPRWLANQGYEDAALTVIAQTYADGDRNSALVLTAFKEISDTMNHERAQHERTLSFVQCFRTPSARRRISLACSTAVFSTIAGNVIASYYLGPLLTNAGVTNTTTQLEINIILNAWSLVCSIAGTLAVEAHGRKPTALISTTLLTIFIFVIGALTKVYGTSTNSPGIYGTVAAVFLFLGSYSYGWTPLLYLYPPEVGTILRSYFRQELPPAAFVSEPSLPTPTHAITTHRLLMVFTMPIALNALGWKLYFINGAWDVLIVAAVALYWVETKGKTLEELDAIFDGEKHSDAPDLVEVCSDQRPASQAALLGPTTSK